MKFIAFGKFKNFEKNAQIKKNFEGPLKLNEGFWSKTKVSFCHLILWVLEIKNKKGKKKLHIRFVFRAPFIYREN